MNFLDTLALCSKRELPAGGQRRSDQSEEEHQDHQGKREEQPHRICADQTRLGGSLFPRKHRGTIFAEIQRTCFTGGLGELSWRKSPLTLLTNCTLPQNLRTTDFTKSNDRFRVHADNVPAPGGKCQGRRVGVSACRRSAFGVRRSRRRGGPEFSGTRANFRMTSHLFVFVADIPWNGRI
jgi:hypothetical protein